MVNPLTRLRRDSRTAIVGAVIVVGLLIVASTSTSSAAVPATLSASTTGCQFEKATQPVQVAFCDTFSQASAPVDGSRSGALNPVVWGVSRVIAGGDDHFQTGTNAGQGQIDNFAPVTMQRCGTSTQVVPDQDVQICDGQLVEAVNDDGGQTDLAMYPRQPFDIAGRTGTVTFGVSDNSQGSHAAWPTFVYTDQPVPAPYSDSPGIMTSARNSFGITFENPCDNASNQGCETTGTCSNDNGVTVGSFFVTSDYRLAQVAVPNYQTSQSVAGVGTMRRTGCVTESTTPTQLNQVELRISQSEVQVWASDAGGQALTEIAELDNASLPLTRGLLWMEDDHYNGDKFATQQSDTMDWSNFGFDGPILPRDLGFDVPDAGHMNGAAEQLGWATNGNAQTVVARGVHGQASATGALVIFNWFAGSESVPSISVNGHAAISTPWPFGDASDAGGVGPTDVWRTIAVPVPLSEVRTGDNSIAFSDAPGGFANVDLILQGAGGVPSCLDPSTCGTAASGSPATPPTHSATPAATPTPRAHHFRCAIKWKGKLTWGTCSGTFSGG